MNPVDADPFPTMRVCARLLRIGAWVAAVGELLVGMGLVSVLATGSMLSAALGLGSFLVALGKAALFWFAFMITAELLELALSVEANTRRAAERTD